jgi:hypothetical protein
MATGNVGYAAESGSELSFGNASGTSTMPETVNVDGPQVAKRTATVSASALAQHLDCSRTYIGNDDRGDGRRSGQHMRRRTTSRA